MASKNAGPESVLKCVECSSGSHRSFAMTQVGTDAARYMQAER